MSAPIQFPTFTAVMDALAVLSSPASAAESHGILCALLCGGVRIVKEAWIDSLLASFVDHQSHEAKEAIQVLTDLFVFTEEGLKLEVTELSVQPLLPENTEPLHLRIQALTEWTQGFLSSLKILGLTVDKANPKEVEDTLADLTKIACLDYHAEDEADAESDASYQELITFVSASALLIHGMKATLFPKAAKK